MFHVSPLFGDHAILPAGKETRIFGTADDGECIHAALADASGAVRGEGECIAQGGRFLLRLPPQEADGAALTLTLQSGTHQAVSADVRVGYLFMAGGQSNMEWSLWNAQDGQALIPTHHDPELRYFNVPRESVEDKAEKAFADTRWQQILPHQGGDISGVAYFFAREVRQKTGVPVGIVGCNWGGTSILSWMDEAALAACPAASHAAAEYERSIEGISLSDWSERQAAFEQEMADWNAAVAAIKAEDASLPWPEIEKRVGVCPWHPPIGPGSPYRPGQLARSMVSRIVPMALTGILFYQGESDCDRASDYGELLITLVRRWRTLLRDPELPFYNVQLPMYIDAAAQDDFTWAVLRQQQEMAWKTLRRSHLAVMIDGGEFGNIHPLDKKTPGQRLARLFLEEMSHVPHAQPWATGKATHGDVLTVTVSQPVQGEGKLFEVAGASGAYVPAQAEVDGCCIRLHAEGVPCPVKARYAWVNWAEVSVFSADGLPLAPFVLED